MTAAGTSVVLLGFFNFLAELFTPNSRKVVYEQQTLRTGDPLDLEPIADDLGNPFAGRVRVRGVEQQVDGQRPSGELFG
jgi:hypothetical protein